MSSICKDCIHRFRMVSLPHRVEEDEEDTVIITVYCTVVILDLTDGDVVDCSHFEVKPLPSDPNVLIDM